MEKVLVLCVIASLSAAAPTSEDAQARILSYENNNNKEGNYEFSFETSNGISREESGRLVNVGEPDEHLVVQGVYSYTDAEGYLVVVRYTADENGYHAEGGAPMLFPPLPLQETFFTNIPPAAVASLIG